MLRLWRRPGLRNIQAPQVCMLLGLDPKSRSHSHIGSAKLLLAERNIQHLQGCRKFVLDRADSFQLRKGSVRLNPPHLYRIPDKSSDMFPGLRSIGIPQADMGIGMSAVSH